MTISFTFDPVKSVEVVRWWVSRHGGSMDRIKLVKLIFLADREHLARHGRPIVGGRYVAMKHGPVSSELLDLVRGKVIVEGSGISVNGYQVSVQGTVDEEQLSESDLEVLQEVDDRFGRTDQWRLVDLTHTMEAWKKNYPDPESSESHDLPYEDFFLDLDPGSRAMLDIIRENEEAEELLSR